MTADTGLGTTHDMCGGTSDLTPCSNWNGRRCAAKDKNNIERKR